MCIFLHIFFNAADDYWSSVRFTHDQNFCVLSLGSFAKKIRPKIASWCFESS